MGDKEQVRLQNMTRKVRCDGTRPHCQRCESSGRVCEGYDIVMIPYHAARDARLPGAQQGSRDDRSGPTAAAAAAAAAAACPLQSLAHHPKCAALDSKDQSALSFYIHSLAPLLDSSLSCSIWQNTALQLSLDTPFVLNAILGLSSACRARTAQGRDATLFHHETHQLSLVQHGRALRQLQQCLQTVPPGGSADENVVAAVVLACLAFVSFHLLQGERSYATSQFRRGLGILHGQTNFNSVELKTVYEEMDGGIWYFRTQPLPSWSRMSFELPQPSSFRDLPHARSYLDLLVTALYQIRDDVIRRVRVRHKERLATMDPHERKVYEQCAAPILDPFLDTDLDRDVRKLQHRLTTWSGAFERIAREHTFDVQDVTRVYNKRLYARQLLAFLRDAASPMCYDEFHTSFAWSLDSASLYLATGPARVSPADKKMVAGPEVLISVFLTGLRCRDPAIRRRALQILKKAQGFSEWSDNYFLAPALERVIDLEEAGASKHDPEQSIIDACDIPMEARIIEVKIVVRGRRPRIAELICGRCVGDRVELFRETL